MSENEKNTTAPDVDDLLESALEEIADESDKEIDGLNALDDEEDEADGDEPTPDTPADDADDEDDSDDGEDGEEKENPEEDSPTDEAGEASKETDNTADSRDRVREQLKRTLKSFGSKTATDEEIIEELQKLAAESEGKTLEEYQEDLRREEEKTLAHEAIYKKDLDAIHAAFPDTAKYTDIRKIPNAERFFDLMSTGKIEAVEAFKICNPTIADEAIYKTAKRTSLAGTKSHMKSSVPKQKGVGEIGASQMEEFRDMFPGKTDKQIANLYAKVTR